MLKSRRPCGLGIAAFAAVVLVLVNPASASEWLEVGPAGTAAVIKAPAVAPALAVSRSDLTGLSLTVQTAGVELLRHENTAGRFLELTWPDASIHGQVGAPALPVIRRLFIAPAGASVSCKCDAGAAVRIDLAAAGLPSWIQPVQASIEKLPGALERAVFAFDSDAYAVDVDVPSERVVVEELGIVRGQRLCLLEIRPVSYNPVAGTLTLFPRISADVSLEGGFIPRDAVSPLPGLRGVVLNPEVLPAAPRGIGNYLIIVANAYAPLIQPFASAKSDQGFTVTTWVPPSASNTVIKTYIQSLWGTSNAPDYVLLVGDTDTIPHWTGGGEGSPSTDIPYVCMDGASDWYPDIAIGRFPVRTAAQFQAIVDKTLLYENGPLPDPGYMNRAVFMASSDNYTVSEGTHNWVIDTYMTPHGIVSDKLYCHTYSATPQQVSNSFNNGRFFGIYSGHGANTYWADGPVFYQSDVNALTNVGMYSFVCSFACVTGTYTDSECFVETWVRAPNKGAVAMYGSSVNSYWTEDDVMERRLFDSIYDDTDPVVAEAGPVWNDARMRYLAEMGSGQTTRRYFEMYNLMGDPALPFFGPNTPPHGLKVTPEDELHAEGPAGGPFTPGSIVYTVKNAGETPMNYAVSKSAQWLSITNATGTLAPRASITVTASINAGANSLGNGLYNDTLAFINTTDHDGDTSRPISVKIGVPQPVLTWPLDTDPGWARQTQWAFGQPTGHGGGTYGGPDPVSGATGTNVFGVNLNGNYAITLDGAHYLTLGPVTLTGITGVILKFQRWLNSDFQPWVSNTIEVSNDNSHWTQVWVNGESEIADRAWSLQSCDIAAVADDRAAVYIRWGYRILRHDAVPYSGWNIDDVEIWGLVAGPAGCPGDANCDDGVNWRDIDYFVSALNSQVAWTAMFAPGTPTCPFSNNDANGDGSVNWRDIDSLVTLMGTVCP